MIFSDNQLIFRVSISFKSFSISLPEQPVKAGRRALHSMVIVIAGLEPENGLYPRSTVVLIQRFCIFSDWFQHRISGLVFPISPGKIYARWLRLHFVGVNVLHDPREPEGSRHAGSSRETICLVERIDGEEPCQRIARDATPTWRLW